MKPTLSAFIDHHIDAINGQLVSRLPLMPAGAERLREAMEYSLLNGGKRIRPLLVLAAAEACGGINEYAWQAAIAVEYVHAYSLIHDDLPAMDDDDLRRGKPTCHIAYDEATAILAGDALQCAAFEILSQDIHSCALMAVLARAAGARGMVVGQAIDLGAVDSELTLEQLSHMHRHKTGALIEASVVMGAIAGGATSEQVTALKQYAGAIGLAFQVQDDILDVVADTETLGKQQGADAANNKPTYVSLLGLAAAQAKAAELHSLALESLSTVPNHGVLAAMADFIVTRSK